MIAIFKKEILSECSSYCTAQAPGKISFRVLERRPQLMVEPQIYDKQCRFQPGSKTGPQIFTLAGLLKGIEENLTIQSTGAL